MDALGITEAYYSKWIGVDGSLSKPFTGVKYIYSRERNICQYGYGAPFDLYILRRGSAAYCSYGAKALPLAKALRAAEPDAAGLTALAEAKAGRRLQHSVKLYLVKPALAGSRARALTPDDYEAYLHFFKAANPGAETGWLYDYFKEMTDCGLCFGLFDGDALVSCADAPGLPYMEDRVCEIGITTLASHRRRGYAADVCATAVESILKSGRCPQWSASADNTASLALAARLGFVKFADVYTLTL